MDIVFHCGLVAGQGVVVVEAIDVNVTEIQLRVGEHRRSVDVGRKLLSWKKRAKFRSLRLLFKLQLVRKENSIHSELAKI